WPRLVIRSCLSKGFKSITSVDHIHPDDFPPYSLHCRRGSSRYSSETSKGTEILSVRSWMGRRVLGEPQTAPRIGRATREVPVRCFVSPLSRFCIVVLNDFDDTGPALHGAGLLVAFHRADFFA